MEELKRQYEIITEGLSLLALSIEDQKKALPAFADLAEDVISEFENAFLLLPQLIENNKFSNDFIASMLRLNNKVQWCLRNIELEDFSNEEWNKVRKLAKTTLALINKPD